MSKFIELTVTTTHEGAELVSDMLWNYTDAGVVINDIEDVIELSKTGKTWDYMDDNVLTTDKRVFVKAYFPIDTADEKIALIERRFVDLKLIPDMDFGTLETSKRVVDGDLWREQWKEHFKPIPIDGVVIVPEWIDYQKKDGEIVIKLDSNMAFGTGEHETTSLCVKYLQKYVKGGHTVLDVGCGSGILGITAAKLGAKNVIMTDIDECAITATEHNMKKNCVTNGSVLLKNLLDDNTVKGNVIACNIMAEVLIAFAPYIGANLFDGGYIILSGILRERLDAVKQAYLDAGFNFIEEKIKGEWSALVMKKGA
jgi:ribosomal protein L11 methyltransferase